jgi:hypothetical protein
MDIMHNFVVCSIFKNEGHILEEWIQHYKKRGVDHIYLVNDSSTDDYLPILENHRGYVTLFHNDIVTSQVGRQIMIYEKYFRPIISESKWISILDMDEFLYSPTGKSFHTVLKEYEEYSEIHAFWIHFGSNNHIRQPLSVVCGFTKRAIVDDTKPYYYHKAIFKGSDHLAFNVHYNFVKGKTLKLNIREGDKADLVINHYPIQSLEYFMKVKATRGDVNNWFDTYGFKRDKEYFEKNDKNDIEDLGLVEQNSEIEAMI